MMDNIEKDLKFYLRKLKLEQIRIDLNKDCYMDKAIKSIANNFLNEVMKC